MKRLLTPRKLVLLLALGWGMQASAMSLGALHGVTMVGQPLRLAADIAADPHDPAAACVRAEVFYGDQRVPDVQLDVQRPAAAPRSRVTISSARPVDEPVVTVVMHAGCGKDTSSRRQVLLAEPSSGEEAPVQARRTSMEAAAVAGAAAARAVEPRRRPLASAARPQARARTRGPRLQLEAAPPAEPGSYWLRASTELRTTPARNVEERAAAALLWQALNAQPRELLRLDERMRSLEADLAVLRQATRLHGGELTQMRGRIGEPSRLAAGLPWLALLGTLVLGTAGFLAWRTARVRRPAFIPSALEPEDLRTDFSGLDFELPAQRAEPVAAEPQEAPAAPPLSPAAHARMPAGRIVPAERVDALGSTLQEVAFLVSLGHAVRAVDVLRGYIERCSEHSPLALLELLQLCASTGDEEGAAIVADDYEHLFHERPPLQGGGLDACEAAVTRVTAAWQTPQAASVIGGLLFCPASVLGGAPGVQAWRDLLALHELARERSGAAQVERLPKAPLDGEELTLERLAGIDIGGAPQRLSLDLDLTQVPASLKKVTDQQHVLKLPPMPDLKVVHPSPGRAAPMPVVARPTHEEEVFEAYAAAEGKHLFTASR